MGVEDIADELYGVAPEDFVARRRDEVARAKSTGDKTLAASLSKLARPTTSAWLVNLLVRHESATVDELLAVGAALRDAQSNLAADALRELSARRRSLVAGLGAAVERLATNAGRTVSDSAGREVGETLDAAVADPAAGDAVRSGRLTRPLRYAGFGPVDLADSVSAPVRHLKPVRPVRPVEAVGPVTPVKPGSPVTPVEPAKPVKPVTAGKVDTERRQHERAVGAARQAVVAATRDAADRLAERDADEVAVRTARNRLAESDRRVADLEAELERARRERSVAQDATSAAERQAAVSARALEQAEQAVAHADAELERLAPDAR